MSALGHKETFHARGRSSAQLSQQRLRLLQIERLKAFNEPAVNRSQQFARLLRFPLVTPEACEIVLRVKAGRSRSPPPLSLLLHFDAFNDPQRFPLCVLLADFLAQCFAVGTVFELLPCFGVGEF
jgi:hypothetical protein